jgi:hypothetical protein
MSILTSPLAKFWSKCALGFISIWHGTIEEAYQYEIQGKRYSQSGAGP